MRVSLPSSEERMELGQVLSPAAGCGRDQVEGRERQQVPRVPSLAFEAWSQQKESKSIAGRSGMVWPADMRYQCDIRRDKEFMSWEAL